MPRRPMISLALSIWTLTAALGATARAADRLPPADEWIPAQAILVVNVRDPKALLDLALRPGLIKAIADSPQYKGLAANQGFGQFLNLVRSLERRMESDWQKILRRLVGGGVTWAIGPNQGYVLIVDSLDAEAPKAVHDLLLTIAGAAAAEAGQPNEIRPTRVGDVDVWSLGPVTHALIGRRLVMAGSPQVLQAVLDLRAGAGGKGVASLAGYRQARQAAPPDAAAMLYANSAVLKAVPQIAQALAADQNPLLPLLAGPLTEAIGGSTWVAAALKAKGDTLILEATCDAAPSATGAARFAMPAHPNDGALPDLAVPRRIAAISLHRDLKGFYAAKDQLFPQRTGGLIFFENMMGIFFSGRDLTEEVLAEMGPKIRLVVAEQKYDPAIGTPALRLPAFALVLPLKNADKFAIVVEEAWQKAVGLINFTRGQKAEPGLIIDRPVHGGTKYTVACFAPPREPDKTAIDIRYNFRPALAMPGNWLILSSTDGLTEDVMDALAKEAGRPAAPRAGVHSFVEVDGPQLSSILAANRDNLIRQNMVDKGHTRERAAVDIDVLLAIAGHIRRAALTVGTDKGRPKASLQVDLTFPPVPSGQAGDK